MKTLIPDISAMRISKILVTRFQELNLRLEISLRTILRSSSRGITMLSIPCKVFCLVILNLIRMAMDQRNREEQSRFRAGRCCSDKIFALTNIGAQFIEWNALIFINFVDCPSIEFIEKHYRP